MNKDNVLLNVFLEVELFVTEAAWEVPLPRLGKRFVQYFNMLIQQGRVGEADTALITPHVFLLISKRGGWPHDGGKEVQGLPPSCRSVCHFQHLVGHPSVATALVQVLPLLPAEYCLVVQGGCVER